MTTTSSNGPSTHDASVRPKSGSGGKLLALVYLVAIALGLVNGFCGTSVTLAVPMN